jgi:hypothetical protein
MGSGALGCIGNTSSDNRTVEDLLWQILPTPSKTEQEYFDKLTIHHRCAETLHCWPGHA